eukprot:600543-Pyramimonas_sp.AAC.1
MKRALMRSLMRGVADGSEKSHCPRRSDSARRTRAHTSRTKGTAHGFAEAERHPPSRIAGAESSGSCPKRDASS